jgi:hypothetical protein
MAMQAYLFQSERASSFRCNLTLVVTNGFVGADCEFTLERVR